MSEADDMDDLKRLLARNPAPTPDQAARERGLAAAREAFQAASEAEGEKTAANLQGMPQAIRQRDRQTGLLTLIRRRLMNLSLPSTRQMMMGGASVAVLTLAVLAVQNQNWRDGLGPMTTGERAEAPLSKAPKPAGPGESNDDFARTGSNADKLTVSEAPKTLADEKRPAPVNEERSEIAAAPPPASPAPARTGDAVGGLRSDDAVVDRAPSVEREADDADAPVAASEAPAVTEAKPAPADGTLSLKKPARQIPSARSQGTARARKAEKGRIGFRANGAATGGAGALNRPAEADTDFSDLAKRRAGLVGSGEAEPAPEPEFKETGRDKFPDAEPSQVKLVGEEPVSTFSVDVDTASYSFMRKALKQGVLPAKDSIRIEELINYFPYDYRAPENRDTPFSANVTVMDTPWNEGTKLMRIGIKGYEIKAAEKPRSNLVFLLDTSGSMNAPDKLPLLIQSFGMLLSTLGDEDTVSIVAYAGSAGVVLEPTKATREGKAQIEAALGRLRSGGSTAGGQGIQRAYDLAEAHKIEDGVNRVILATDGDFNVGIQNTEELKGFIERKRDTGVFLSVLGFGRGNYNDALMQALAQNGNGVAAYIDSTTEAQKVLVDEASSTLFPIAKDVKIQVEFNPNVVAEYRLIGYETRKLNREDFNNDKIDAAEIGAGHTVTALYEITPVGSEARLVDPSRYGGAGSGDDAADKADVGAADLANEYAFVRIRYKDPDADKSKLITRPVTKADEIEPDDDARFASAVAAFGQILKGGRYTGAFTFDDVIRLANGAKGADPYNYRGEFVSLVRQAKTARAMERR